MSVSHGSHMFLGPFEDLGPLTDITSAISQVEVSLTCEREVLRAVRAQGTVRHDNLDLV